MTVDTRRPPDTVADALARRARTRQGTVSARSAALRELGAVDRAVYDAVARTPTAALDGPVRRLSTAADHSRLWLAIAAAIGLLGGWRGRRAALEGVVSIGVTSATVNLGAKSLHRRRRPHNAAVLPAARQVPMPTSTSLVLLAAALALSGCGSLDPGRNPSGATASRAIDAAGVTRLDVAYGFDVRVRIGQPEAATVTYDDNLADLLDVRVDGRTLRIQLKPDSNIEHRPTLRAEVTISRLEELRATGASTVTVASKIFNSGLRLLISGSSRVTADLALNQASATVSGASRLQLTGTAKTLRAAGSGASSLELAGLRLQDVDITLSGASHGSVQVDRTIAAQVSGASKLTYKGTPQFTKRDTSGASSIQSA